MSEYQNQWYHANKDRLKDGRKMRHQVEYKKRKQLIKEHKLEAGGCSICGFIVTEDNHVAFDWDHIDPSQKLFGLGDTRSQPLDVVVAEIAKCRLLCKNCHAIETHRSEHWALGRVPKAPSKQLSLLELP